jgi:hypothetical protein
VTSRRSRIVEALRVAIDGSGALPGGCRRWSQKPEPAAADGAYALIRWTTEQPVETAAPSNRVQHHDGDGRQENTLTVSVSIVGVHDEECHPGSAEEHFDDLLAAVQRAVMDPALLASGGGLHELVTDRLFDGAHPSLIEDSLQIVGMTLLLRIQYSHAIKDPDLP